MKAPLRFFAATAVVGAVFSNSAMAIELRALYEFEEATGNTFAESQGGPGGGFGGTEGVDFTLNEPGAPGTAGTSGFRNLGVSTGGVGFVSDPSGIFEVPDSLTVAVWARPATFSNFYNFVDYSNTGTGADFLSAGFRLQTINNADNNNVRLLVETGGGRAAVRHPRELVADTWHLLVLRYDHLTGQAGLNVLTENDTVNTSLVASNFQSTTNSNFAGGVEYAGAAGILVISDPNDAQGVNAGSFDDVAVFSGLLTDQQVVDLYTTGVRSIVTVLSPGDVDGDGVVDIDDFDIIRNNFFDTVATRGEGDLTGDGLVDFADFRTWKDSVPPPVGATAAQLLAGLAPEPSSLLLCFIGLAFTRARPRRR
ncbi:MAG: LamG-like jellyroll fold domain-containing protein [Planctomycetota bacterium]